MSVDEASQHTADAAIMDEKSYASSSAKDSWLTNDVIRCGVEESKLSKSRNVVGTYFLILSVHRK